MAGSQGPDSEPVWLEFADVLELYAAIIGCTTRRALDQLRDRAGLESALGRPLPLRRAESDGRKSGREARAHRGQQASVNATDSLRL